jgi:transposase
VVLAHFEIEVSIMSTLSTPPSEYAAWIGLDWADRSHAVSLRVEGSQQVESFQIEQKPEALSAWIAQLRERFGGRPVALSLEQSRGPLLFALMHIEFIVLYPVNPKALARFRDSLNPSGSKDDPGDAACLRELIEKHTEHFIPWKPEDPDTRQIQLLSEYRRKLVHTRTRLTNQITDLLKNYYPQALQLAGELDSPMACDFLLRWPCLSKLQKVKPRQLEAFYLRHNCRNPERIQQRLALFQKAQPLTTDTALIESMKRMLVALVRQLQPVLDSISDFDVQIKSLYENHPEHEIFASFPGAGDALGPRLLAAFGRDRNKFQAASQIRNLSGIAPITRQSGKTRLVQARIACPKFLRQTFHEFALHSLNHCPWADALYQSLKARGVSTQAAVRVVAYKWISILFICWKNHTPYDEQIYLAAKQRRSLLRPNKKNSTNCGKVVIPGAFST